MSLYIGLMSGTSMDGIDAVILDVTTNKVLASQMTPYSAAIETRLLEIQTRNFNLQKFAELDVLLGQQFAACVNELLKNSQISFKKIKAIGSHGQTICHNVKNTIPYTLQLGCAHTIAELTKIPVVADFRKKDIVLGGQGAPFAPIYHQQLFKEKTLLVNIGGIANITVIDSKLTSRGWDIGPGNCLLDSWIAQHLNKSFDAKGSWAAQGVVDEKLLQSLLDDSFFSLTYPKSIGREYFSLTWLEKHLTSQKPVDVQATLAALTCESIINDISKVNDDYKKIYLCGGGAHNLYIVNYLKSRLPHMEIAKTDALGLNCDYLEAMMFAWLASKTMHKLPLDLRNITGSSKPQILGAVYYA